jgi:hypothetical protein
MSAASEAANWLYDFVLGVLQAPTWSVPVMEFIDLHCSIFDAGDENKLEYTTIHERFCELIEKLLESHLADIGLTPEDFAAVCAAAPRGSGLGKIVFEQLMSATDFLTFKALMRKRCAELELEAIREFKSQQRKTDTLSEEEEDEDDELHAALELSREMMKKNANDAVSNVRTAQAEVVALEEAEAKALEAYEEAQLAAAIAASIASDETWHEAERMREAEEQRNEQVATTESVGFAEDIEIEREKKQRKETENAVKKAIAEQTESSVKIKDKTRLQSNKGLKRISSQPSTEQNKISLSKLPSLFGTAQPSLELSGLEDVLQSTSSYNRRSNISTSCTDVNDIEFRNTTSSGRAEIKERHEHLRDMRDALKEKHREERQRALEEAEATSGHTFADTGVRATLQAALAQVKNVESKSVPIATVSHLSDEEKALQARRTMAARLKQEGGIKR